MRRFNSPYLPQSIYTSILYFAHFATLLSAWTSLAPFYRALLLSFTYSHRFDHSPILPSIPSKEHRS
ncbi:hypothetical protein Pst134EB_027182 [Puccinia striiformis f. sp. tritici]|nr:hypothetical protein Pst134EB_027182 [Puccinia striiformis f. sp. tritici]